MQVALSRRTHNPWPAVARVVLLSLRQVPGEGATLSRLVFAVFQPLFLPCP